LPDQTYPSTANDDRGDVQFASEFSELSIATIEQRSGLSICGVIMIDQSGQFRQLILQLRLIWAPRGHRPLAERMWRAAFLPAQLGENPRMISIHGVTRDASQSTEFRNRCTLMSGIAALSSFEEVERLGESGAGCGRSIWMNCGHDINPSFARWRVTSIASWRS
jgi:hypothetical protein